MRSAAFLTMGFRSGRVPTKTMVPSRNATARVRAAARRRRGIVLSKLMMVMPARLPYAYGVKAGFNREVECPKCAPAAISDESVNDDAEGGRCRV